MSTPSSPSSEPDSDAYRRARRKVGQIKGFYVHATTYGIVIGALFLINLANGRPWWFFWPALGWGIGLAFHAFGVYGPDAFLGKDWEERKTRELMERERRRTG